MGGLLEGVVVLDLTRVLAGPFCGVLMADMGATVIKVENPKGGDDTRAFGPFINDNSVYFANFNRSKQGVTLNLKEPEAKEIFKEMVKHADVVIAFVKNSYGGAFRAYSHAIAKEKPHLNLAE